MDIVDEQDPSIPDQLRVRWIVNAQHVGTPGGLALQPGLGGIVLYFVQQLHRPGVPMAADGLRQQPGLVIPARFQTFLAHRYPSHRVKFSTEPLRRTPGQKLTKGLRQSGAAPEFQTQQSLPHRALIPERGGAGQVLLREGHLFLRKPRQVLLALGADAHGVQDFAAKGAFGRKKQVDDAFKKMIHFFFRG